MSEMKRQALEWQRLRMLSSVGDFQLASSAVAFLAECDPEQKYSKVELRRFRCYETTIIMAYTRPFSESKGEIPRLTLKMSVVKLNGEQKKLHDTLMDLRNKVIAHSDAEMMRFASYAHPTTFANGFEFVLLETVFDEGLTFVGLKLITLDELISVVFHAVFTKLLEEAQKEPKDFNLRKDYLK